MVNIFWLSTRGEVWDYFFELLASSQLADIYGSIFLTSFEREIYIIKKQFI